MARGRGGRGNGTDRGRGTAARKSTAIPVKRTAAVPAFPVVSRGDAPPPASTRHAAHDNNGDDAPPVAVSARRGNDDNEDTHTGFVPPNATRARGRGGVRRGGGGRGGRRELLRGNGGFRGGHGTGGHGWLQRGLGNSARGGCAVRRDEADGDHHHHGCAVENSPHESGDAEEKHKHPTRVITTVTDSGTELPRKLNTKVFIDGLPYTYTPEPGKPTLEEEVMQFATAWKVGKPLRLIKKPGQGFGFLVLQSPNSVATAVRVLNGRKFLGRALRVEEPKPKDFEKMKDIGGMRDMGKDSFTRQVLLTDLAKVAQPEIIREVLRDVAPQLEKKLEAIKMTSQNRKAFLTFESEAEVGPAIKFLDGFHLLGRRISATQAAAPGSLPFSHGGTGPSRGGLAAAAAATAAKVPAVATHHAVEEDDELTVVPLGVEPVKVSAAPSPSLAARRREEAAAANAVTGSNITGRTEKYNLLDDGPKDIYVGNLGEDVTEAQLRQHFAPCGAIRTCEILVHPETHLSTGIAHIAFALPAYAAYAQERYHGSRLRGYVLRVDRGDTASVPLAAELPPAEVEDDYDEDAYMKHYGVKDKKAFFKGTSVAAEMGADSDFDEDEEVEDEDSEAGKTAVAATTKNAKKDKRARTQEKTGKKNAAAAAPAAKRARTETAPVAERGTVKAVKATRLEEDDDENDDMNLVTSHAMSDGDDGSDEEEHFFDADTVPVAAGNAAASKKGLSKGVSLGKKTKKHGKSKAGKNKK